MGETIGKGLLLGFSASTGVEAINTFAKKSTAVQATAAKTTAAGKAVARITGLGCPCQNPQQHVADYSLNARRRRRGMGMFVTHIPNDQAVLLGNVKSLDEIANTSLLVA
ncbi:hypothetical protein D3C80_1312170 [compost metagenome]